MCGACRSNREAKRSGSPNEASITAASSVASGTGRVVRPVMGVLASSALLGRRDRPRAGTAGGLYLLSAGTARGVRGAVYRHIPSTCLTYVNGARHYSKHV